MILDIGSGAVIYKRDLRHAYRQFPVDPADYYLLGYNWNDQYYFDTVLAMGQRNAGIGCSRVTRAIMYIHGKAGHRGVSYLDDLIGVSNKTQGPEAYTLETEHTGQALGRFPQGFSVVGIIHGEVQWCCVHTLGILDRAGRFDGN